MNKPKQYYLLKLLKSIYWTCSNAIINTSLFDIKKVFLTQGNNKNLISFCLYGNGTRYINNIENCITSYRKIFNDWIIRVYVSADTKNEVIEYLSANNCEVIIMKMAGIDSRYMYWRFLPLDDPNVNRVIIRDIDSLASERELHMVTDWIASKKKLHIIRDHPLHQVLILGGMWGMKVENNKYGIRKKMLQFKKINRYGNDQLFLETLYHQHKNDLYLNDIIKRRDNEFPVILENNDDAFFIGKINLQD